MDDGLRKVRNKRNESISNDTMMTLLDEQKMCFHHNLKDLEVHTDGAWLKFKKYNLHPGIGNYPQECIVYLEPFKHKIFQ